MSASPDGANRRWIWASLGALAIAGGLAFLFRVSVTGPKVPESIAPRSKPVIELAERREKSALDDEATLLDPTPLFQPTRWNTAQMKVDPPEPSGSFQSFRVPPKLAFADTDLKLGRIERAEDASANYSVSAKLRTSLELPNPVAVPDKPVDVLSSPMPGSMAAGMGRTDSPVPTLASRGPSVEIVEIGTGRVALPPNGMASVRAIVAEARPPGTRPWRAMEFLAVVNAAGLAAPLTVITRSEVDEVDSYFQNFLARTLRVGDRLGPGFYRISIGP